MRFRSPVALEQPGNPKTAWLGSLDEAVDSCAPPGISLSLRQEKGTLSHQQTNLCCIDSISINRIPVGWWAGQNWRGCGRAGGTPEPTWQGETHPSPGALLVPLAIAIILGKKWPEDSVLYGNSPVLWIPALLHIPVFLSSFPIHSFLC